MAKIADELVAILRNNSVPQGIIEHLEKSGCTTVKMLANWVDEPKELKAAVLSQCQDFKDDNMALAAVKQSWKEADAINTKALKRGADGMEEVNMDEPLSKFEQDSLDQNFLTLYNWELEPGNRARIPIGTMFGKVLIWIAFESLCEKNVIHFKFHFHILL